MAEAIAGAVFFVAITGVGSVFVTTGSGCVSAVACCGTDLG